MSLTGKLILAALAAVLLILFIPPVLASIALLGFLVGLFGAAVALWACVLLGERWVDEGLRGYNYLDALDDSLQNVFQGLRRLFVAKKRESLKARLVASWPLIKARGRVITALAALPVLLPIGVVVDGLPKTLRDLRRVLTKTAPNTWRGLYL